MYFEGPGKTHTEETLKRAFERAMALGLNEVVVASTSGDTALKAVEIFKKFTLTAVSYHCGFRKPFESVMDVGVRNDLLAQGVNVISATHALSGVERAVAKKHGGVYPALLIADTLKLFGQGTKVAVEVAIMAADSRALSGRDIVSIGGSGKGSDTALVLKPANQSDMFDMRIREVVCKPRNF